MSGLMVHIRNVTQMAKLLIGTWVGIGTAVVLGHLLYRREVPGTAFLAALILWFVAFTLGIIQLARPTVSRSLMAIALGTLVFSVGLFAADGLDRNQLVNRRAELENEIAESREQNLAQTAEAQKVIQEKTQQVVALEDEVARLKKQLEKAATAPPASSPAEAGPPTSPVAPSLVTNLADLPIVFNEDGVVIGNATLFGEAYPQAIVFNTVSGTIDFCVGFNVGAAYDRFDAKVGVTDNTDSEAIAIVKSFVPGNKILKKTRMLHSGDPPVRITLSIKGVVRLDLCGHQDRRYDFLRLIWVDAKVTKD